MKYSLTFFQPLAKAALTACSRSSSVTPLLITSRIRWLPASGANVRPLFRTACTFLATSTLNASMRKLGKDTLTFLSLKSAIIVSKNGPRQE